MNITKYLKQTCVYWGSPIVDGYGGRTFDAPVELSCRWEDRRELFRDASGNEVVSESIVLLGQSVDLGGFLYLGTISDLDSSLSVPSEVDGMEAAREIRYVKKTPDLKGTIRTRRVFL